jgi:hypothetical protein
MLGMDRANASVGKYRCEPYSTSDPRSQPQGIINSANLTSEGNGYLLSLTLKGTLDIPLDSNLHLDSPTKIPYTLNPLKISSRGKFSITILKQSNICTYTGTAKISSDVSTRLFKKRSSITG